MIAAKYVVDIVEYLAREKNTGAFIVMSAGFSEEGAEGKKLEKDESKRDRLRYLPDNIYDAIALAKASKFLADALGEESKEKFIKFKQASADRSPKALGGIIKASEVLHHHEVTNQLLWSNF